MKIEHLNQVIHELLIKNTNKYEIKFQFHLESLELIIN